MSSDQDQSRMKAAAELRRQAEKRLREKTGPEHSPRGEEETKRLVHELEVHQIELEMQNAELRQARDEVEKALEKYTDLYDFAPVGYFTLDREGDINAVNLSGASLLGIERSRLIGWRFGQFVAERTRPYFTEFLGKVFSGRGKKSCEVALTREGCRAHAVQVEAVAADSGQECRLAVIDISVRRKLEEHLETLHSELAARAAELMTANTELEAFNYTVSHDLRKPLTVIHGYSYALLEMCGDQLDEQSTEYLREIHTGTLRMNRLIDTLLEFSGVTRVEIRRETVDLGALAKAVAEELQRAEPNRRVALRIAEGVMVKGDVGLLRVVLDNLIGNAWKFAGGREGAFIEFGVRDVDGRPAFFIRDNGPGFDMAMAERLFEPFQRIPGTEVEGSGIGLATVARIVNRLGGRVWAESLPGKGATFLFTLEEPPES